MKRELEWLSLHRGFHVYCVPSLQTIEEVLKVGYYIIRPAASAARLKADDAGVLKYLAKEGYRSIDGASLFEPPGEHFDYLDWIARDTSHIQADPLLYPRCPQNRPRQLRLWVFRRICGRFRS